MPKVAIVLTQSFADWEYALLAGTGGPYYGLDVQYFTPTPGTVSSMGGLVAHVDQGLESLAAWAPEAVVVCGGMIWATEDAPDLGELLRVQHDRGAVVAGICGGTVALARAGLLDGVGHTSNDLEFLQQNAVGYAGEQKYLQSALAVSDNRVITAPGTAPVSFAAVVFEGVGLDGATVGQFRQMLAAEHA